MQKEVEEREEFEEEAGDPADERDQDGSSGRPRLKWLALYSSPLWSAGKVQII